MKTDTRDSSLLDKRRTYHLGRLDDFISGISQGSSLAKVWELEAKLSPTFMLKPFQNATTRQLYTTIGQHDIAAHVPWYSQPYRSSQSSRSK